MANLLETWWAENYPKRSLESLETFPIYAKFKSSEEPFSRTDLDVTESFHITAKVSWYECRSEFSGEKLSYFPESKTWLYENWTKSSQGSSESMTWRHPNCEWGVLTHKDADLDQRESWKLEGGSRVYEQTTVQNSVTTGQRHGSTQSPAGLVEDWSESLLESPAEIRFERTWRQPGSSGGEIRGRTGLRHYGETWFRSSTASETKEWSSEDGREKGSCAGFTGKRKFTHLWDFEGLKKSEIKTYQEGSRNWGSRKKTIGGEKWLNEEWDGLPPTDPGQCLSTIYERCIIALVASEATLDSLSTPDTADQIRLLSFQRKDLTPGQDADAKLTAVVRTLNLLTEQEELKRTLFDGIRAKETRELSEGLADIVSVYSALLRLMATSSLADSSLSEPGKRMETQIQELQKSADFSDLEIASEYLRLLKDQTRLVQVFTQKLINREAEISKSLSQIKTQLQQVIEQIAEETEEREELRKTNEVLKDLRTIAKVSDLVQSLPKVVNCILVSRPNPPDSESSLFPLLTALSDTALALETDFAVSETSANSLNAGLSDYRTNHALSSFCQALNNVLMRLHRSPKRVPSQTVDWAGFMRETHLCALILSEIGTFLANDIHSADLFNRAHVLGLEADRILADYEATKNTHKVKHMSKLIQQYGALISDVSAQLKAVKSRENTEIGSADSVQELETVNELMRMAIENGIEVAQRLGSEEGLLEQIEDASPDPELLIPTISHRVKVVLKLLRMIQEKGECGNVHEEAGGKRSVFEYQEEEGEIGRLREELEVKDNMIAERNTELEKLRSMKEHLKRDLEVSRAKENRAKQDLLDLINSHDAVLLRLSELEQNPVFSVVDKPGFSSPGEEIARLRTEVAAHKQWMKRKTVKFITDYMVKTDQIRLSEAIAIWRPDSIYSIPPEGEAKRPSGNGDEVPPI